MNEAVNRWVCDGCGKVIEVPPQPGYPAAPPDGWFGVEVSRGDALVKEGDLCSKSCAAKWLLKRERRRKALAPQTDA